MIKLGDKVKDTVTGFSGVATAKVEFLNGCIQFMVTPKMAKPKKNETPEYPTATYIDVEQLVMVGVRKKTKSEPSGGGIRQHPGF